MSRLLEVLVTCFRPEDRHALARMLARCGLKPVLSASVERSRGLFARRPVRLIFCDDELPDGSVARLLEEVRNDHSRVPVVVISRLENWDEYLRAMRLGAFDYVSSPLRRAEVERVVARALEETPAPPIPPGFDPDGGSGGRPERQGSNREGRQAGNAGEKKDPHTKSATSGAPSHRISAWDVSQSNRVRATVGALPTVGLSHRSSRTRSDQYAARIRNLNFQI